MKKILLFLLVGLGVFNVNAQSKKEIEVERIRRQEVIESREKNKANHQLYKITSDKSFNKSIKEPLVSVSGVNENNEVQLKKSSSKSIPYKVNKPKLGELKIAPTISGENAMKVSVEKKIQSVRIMDEQLKTNYSSENQITRTKQVSSILETNEVAFKLLNQEYQEMILVYAKERDGYGHFYEWFKEGFKK